MTETTKPAPQTILSIKHPLWSAADRRARSRVNVVGRVHIRGGMGTLDDFEDLGHTIDVTRDGLLLSPARDGYWIGQVLDIVFPYWTSPTAMNIPRKATVVRSVLQPDLRHAIAVEFDPSNNEAPSPIRPSRRWRPAPSADRSQSRIAIATKEKARP